MEKVRIGVICPSEIAFRRFMPAIQKCENAEYIGVAHASTEEWDGNIPNGLVEAELAKARSFQKEYGGKIYDSYEAILTTSDVDAVYLPLPPALHYKWARKTLENGKHIFLEKPSTTGLKDTEDLINLAKEKGLAVHENYMFSFHKQLEEIADIVNSGELGDVRLYRIAFGFPRRAQNDFRYNKSLGGGALLDCGGYTLKLASMLLGNTAKIATSKLNYMDGFEVDMYGSATMVNDAGMTAQLSFGMDNSYKCELEIWGSKGCLTTGRILTAPDGFEPMAEIEVGNETRTVKLSADDTFKKSIQKFCRCVKDDGERIRNYAEIVRQAELVEKIKEEKLWRS